MHVTPQNPRRLAAAGVLAALLAAAPVSAFTGFPVASLGDIWFQADHAAFMLEDGGAVQEFYIRVTNNQLSYQGDEEQGEQLGRVEVKLRFLDADEDEVGEAAREFEFVVPDPATAASADHAELLVMREEVDPRTRFVRVELNDMNARKRGLLYLVTGKRKNGEATGVLAPPPFLGDSLATSDLQFAWRIETEGEARAFEKSGFNVIPNPSRAYGLLQPTVSVYFEVYDLRGTFSHPRTYTIDYELVNAGGSVAAAFADTVSSRSGRWARTAAFDGSGLPTGEYVLRCRVEDLVGEGSTVTERPFNLVWRPDAWERTEEEVLNQARVLFTEDEFDRFRDMSIADRELHLARFWAEHDPSPATPGNELRAEFLRRVAYANLHFSAFGQEGMITDRGRIYIRFGEPDEVETELVPTRDRQLDNLLDEFGEDNAAARRLESADDFDTRPYIVWDYTVQGQPLFPEREFGTSVTGLRFVFVDETGTGHFVLRYTSDFINY